MTDLPPPPPPPPYVPYAPTPPARRRAWPIVLSIVVALVFVVAVVALPLVLVAGGDPDPAEPVEAGAADLSEVRVYDDLDPAHLPGDIDYEQTPPAGGPHAATWLDCGAYDVPVREENVVHDLEHGTVWITYRDDLVEAAGVGTLLGLLPDNGILSPHPDQEAPVVITVWGRQLDLAGAHDPRIELFIAEFSGGVTAPEPMASCHGGHPDPQGPVDDGTDSSTTTTVGFEPGFG